MGKIYPEIDDRLARFIDRQHMFFVSTAPTSTDGHVNVSPKGLDTFRILDPHTVAYLDLTGSGVETISHLRENGRITLMFCAFEGAPKILRLYGRGAVIEPGTTEFEELLPRFPSFPAIRSIIRVSVSRVADSCGFGVPQLAYAEERSQLPTWAERQGERKIQRYQQHHNASIDGLPGLTRFGSLEPERDMVADIPS